MRARQRISAFIALSAAAVGVTAIATSAEATTAPRSSTACTKAAGKYHGTLVGQYELIGYDSQGQPKEKGGALKVWHSHTCGTLWARVIKDTAYTRVARETGVLVDFYNTALKRDDYLSKTATTKAAVETRAVPVGAHGSAHVIGDFLGDYDYIADVTVPF
jgi:hypothetical protein